MNEEYERKAKAFYVTKLNGLGFTDVEVISSPADITAYKNGKQWFFEIKATKKQDSCFGAATFTEWEQAFKTPDTFRFVIIKISEDEKCFESLEFTPDEFIKYSSIPPIKVFFNINFKNMSGKKKTNMSKESFELLSNTYKKLKKR